MGIMPDTKLREQVEDLHDELKNRDELAQKRNMRMFVVGLVVGSIGTGASIIGVLLALKVI